MPYRVRLCAALDVAALALPARLLALLACVAAAIPTGTVGAAAVEEAQAAKGPPLDVALFVSSRSDACHDPGDLGAITRLTRIAAERINAAGGVHGRPLRLRLLDDRRDDATAIANVREALAAPELLAMIGLSNSNRSKAVFEALGPEIGRSGVPFLSHISVATLFAPYPNVFTTQSSQEDERVPLIVRFTKEMGFTRPAFLGVGDAVFSTALGDGLKASLGNGSFVADQRLKLSDDKLDPTEVATAVEALRAGAPDIAFLSVGSARTAEVLNAMMTAGVTPAVFMSGRIDQIPADVTARYPNAIYQLSLDRLPEVDNTRIRRLVALEDPAAWVFEGAVNPGAPGWAKGECKTRPEGPALDPFEQANLRAIGIGARYADMVALVAQAARAAGAQAGTQALRARVVDQLTNVYVAGRGAFKGLFENWSFKQPSRAAARTPFIVILPQGLGRTQLAPLQFLRARDGTLRRVPTLYVDIDLIEAHRVDDNDKTFFADFYLSMRDNGAASIERIEFANAYLDPRTGGRQIKIDAIHGGGPSDAYPATMRIYRVSGRFLFEPELSRYPFDTQLFPIDLQPKSGEAPFIVQPPPGELRDPQFKTDGWDPLTQYVGTEEDFVPVIDAFTHQPSVVPFYRATFGWLMKRQTTDYYLRVVVPLAFILIVAYLSIFIPRSHFEAIVTIQVTALLSAVALYLSLPQLDSDTATVSDRLFVLNYMMVSLMIVISILRVNGGIAARRWLTRALEAMHVVLIPLLVAFVGYYVWRLQDGA